MLSPKEEDYVDTNVVIESHRVEGWNALASNRQLSTVAKVIEECATGSPLSKEYVVIDAESVRGRVKVYETTPRDCADLRLRLAGEVNLDAGEEALLAKAVVHQGKWTICSPDKALIRACSLLGYLNNVVSLEFLLSQVGFRLKTQLQRQYTTTWLSQIKSELLFETL
jgi:hypothetical protein